VEVRTVRFAPASVLLLVATAGYGADDAPKATRQLGGDKTTFPAKSIAEGVRAAIGVIESCHSSTGWVDTNPELADLEKARKGDHVRLVFSRPITVTVLNHKVEFSEVVFSAGVFWLRRGEKVLRCAKYECEKMKPFEAWYRQTLPVD
jgi:hypothetical protein